jgi:hypothetical protein
MIQREAVVFARPPENKEQKSETRDDVTDEAVERIVQQMAEGDDDQDEAKRDESVAGTQAQDNGAPAMSSMNGMVTPTAHNDQTGRKVSVYGRKYFRACSSGPS